MASKIEQIVDCIEQLVEGIVVGQKSHFNLEDKRWSNRVIIDAKTKLAELLKSEYPPASPTNLKKQENV